MKAMGAPYKGVLFAGIMLTDKGPKLVEYNARFGDPECQVLMLRMMSDIVPALIACADGQLKKFRCAGTTRRRSPSSWRRRVIPATTARARASRGWTTPRRSKAWRSSMPAQSCMDGHITAYGGRVLNVCALGKTVSEARERAYAAIGKIRWPEGFCRSDIGWREVERERAKK